MADVATLDGFFRLMNANGAVRVYQEALACGLLAALMKGPRSMETVARECELAAGPAGLMLEVLRALGLVEARGEEWAVTALAGVLLAGSYRMLGDLYWGHLGAFMKSGVPMARMDEVSQSEVAYAGQAEALAWMSGPAAALAAQRLSPGVPAGGRILDVGAGSGIWSLTVARAVAGATVTAVDWPAVLAVAEKVAARMGMGDRLRQVPGNYHEVALGAGSCDLAVVANVLHLETEAGCLALLRKVHGALKPGGRLAVIDVLAGRAVGGEGELNRALYAMGLALRTAHGRVWSVEEIQKMMAESGFGAGEVVGLEVVPHALGMIVAQRE